ncbi:transforming acidic coiled-coil-containing 3 [Pelobates cultripes]|uniref:Transforming acidic coiled-coil-containing 3 n=1 Tax=Pelobates cultripes TaxID=61616 RepID=A0AAD1SE03_PELCU|nr:transforming acidic coiled-coil-containing 3 [Pelobates cultripes]
MSVQLINDENVRSDLTAESCDFLLIAPQPTGRPSILRPSQKDNLPPKDAAKSIKVTFQTPMRDPQTRKIVTSSIEGKVETVTLEDCTQALQKLHLSVTDANCTSNPEDHSMKCDQTALPDDIPVKSMGAYNIDFDKLDEMNPFKSTTRMQNSPVKSECSFIKDVACYPDSSCLEDKTLSESAAGDAGKQDSFVKSLSTSPTHVESPVTVRLDNESFNTSGKSTLEDTLPLSTRDSNSSLTVSNEGTTSNIDKVTGSDLDVCPTKDSAVDAVSVNPNTESIELEVPSSPPLPKSSYKFDPEQIDMIDPFNTGGSKLKESPVKSAPGDASDDNAGPVKLEFNFGEGDPPVKKPPPRKLGKRPTLSSSKKQSGNVEKTAEKPKVKAVEKPLEEEVIVPKAAYNFDWEKFDDPSFNPFASGGSKICTTLTTSTVKNDLTPSKEDSHPKVECQDSDMVQSDKLVMDQAQANDLNETGMRWTGGLLLLGGTRGLDVTRPQGSKKIFLLTARSPEGHKQQLVETPQSEAESIVLCNSDTGIQNETKLNVVVLCCTGASHLNGVSVNAFSINPFMLLLNCLKYVAETTVNPVSDGKEVLVLDEKPLPNEPDFPIPKDVTLSPSNDPELLDAEFKPATDHDFLMMGEMDFKPATEFFPSTAGLGQSAEMDYLESFGSSTFKESALRKQSLYLKFDPLLRESPKKTAPAGAEFCIHVPMKNSSELFRTMSDATLFPIPCHETEEKPEGLDLLGTYTATNSGPLIPDPPLGASTSDPYPLISDLGSIVEVLKYSQKDMDAAVDNVRLEVQEKELEVEEWKHKHEKLYLEYIEMGKIIAEFETTITQILEDSQRQKELTKQELQKVLEEKQQVQMDLNSMEKSFSDLFKRFEKQKEIIDGYRKNEETLKKCVEDYHLRIKKEEQRYQALKAHAEEKLNCANEEIAQVRNKAKSETVVLQCTLRKEQMKIQSLERSLEQKAKEIEELTKICDDLILKMEKI